VRAVFWKELADYFGSWRFLILFAIICLTALLATYTAGQTIVENVRGTPTEFVFLRLFTTSGGNLLSLISFLGFLFGPLIGIIFGFDVVNSEHSRGTLSRVLAQPVYRDSVINGKFLAGLTAVAIILLSVILIVSGWGLRTIGVAPSLEEIARIAIFFVVSLIYVGFWLGLGILFSVLFKRTITSALTTIVIWLFLAFFMTMIAGFAADQITPVDSQSAQDVIERNIQIESTVKRVSPTTLFSEATQTILAPTTRMIGGLLVPGELIGASPLSTTQSLLIVWPHLVALIALTLICFTISYVRFMRQEIRST